MKTFINYGRWYYDHASTMLPVWTDEQGYRDYPDRYLALGESVTIRNATVAEHRAMAERFDQLTDKMAAEGPSCWVYGLGNFEKDDPPPGLADAIAGIKARARTEPFRDAPPPDFPERENRAPWQGGPQ